MIRCDYCGSDCENKGVLVDQGENHLRILCPLCFKEEMPTHEHIVQEFKWGYEEENPGQKYSLWEWLRSGRP